VLWLAGCATLPEPAEPGRVYSGRFAATTTVDDRRENTSGRFTLAVGERLVLDLATPVGTTLARFDSGPEGATMQVAGNGESVRRSRDAEALALEVLGWPLPVAGIGDWIEGRPAPARASRTAAGNGGIASIEQDGWTIEITERFEAGAPRRLVMSRPARPDAPAVTLRIVLDAPASQR